MDQTNSQIPYLIQFQGREIDIISLSRESRHLLGTPAFAFVNRRIEVQFDFETLRDFQPIGQSNNTNTTLTEKLIAKKPVNQPLKNVSNRVS